LRTRLFYYDYAFAFDNLGFHLLLLIRFQVALVLGLLAHALHSFHHIVLLSQKRVAEIGRPLDVVRKSLHHVGESG
jgi:hypothetical protein